MSAVQQRSAWAAAVAATLTGMRCCVDRENEKRIEENASHIAALEARQAEPTTPTTSEGRDGLGSPLLPPPSPLGSLPVTPTGAGQTVGLEAAEAENEMLRTIVQQMRQEMEALQVSRHQYRCRLRCILLKMPAISLLAGGAPGRAGARAAGGG